MVCFAIEPVRLLASSTHSLMRPDARRITGPIAQALMAKAPDLFAQPPAIEKIDVLGAKLP